MEGSPYGEWFIHRTLANEPLLFFQGGWGKTNAAGSTQYIIDHWQPQVILNIGTCGGFDGQIQRGDVILVKKTLQYDIEEQMADPQDAIAAYTTELDLSFLPSVYPLPVIPAILVSADRDLRPEDIHCLHDTYGAIAADWESASIASIVVRNRTKCLILRGVTDLVHPERGGEAYQNIELFSSQAEQIMQKLFDSLPTWIGAIQLNEDSQTCRTKSALSI